MEACPGSATTQHETSLGLFPSLSISLLMHKMRVGLGVLKGPSNSKMLLILRA